MYFPICERTIPALNSYRIRERIPNLLQFLITSGHWDKEAVSVAHSHAAEDAAATNGSVNHGDNLELGLNN